MLDDLFAAKDRAPFSEWGWFRQIVAMVIFTAIVIGAAWLVRKAIYHWLPEWITVPVGLAAVAFSVAFYAREWFLRLNQSRRGRLPRRPE